MDELLRSGANVISQAEEELRRLLGRAAEIGDYDSLLVLTEWARLLSNLLEKEAKRGVRESTAEKFPIPEQGEGGEISAPTFPMLEPRNGPASSRGTLVRRKKRAAKLKKRSSSRPPDYPKFLCDGENLVKIGWSKSEKAPYEHKAPRRVLTTIVDVFKREGRNGRRFTMEDVLPLKDPDDRTEIPTYQVYLCLAWLRAEGLIVQHGRQGYSLPVPDGLEGQAEECFRKLPRR